MKDRAISRTQKIQLINRLLKLWFKHPNLRLGQLFLNLNYDFYATEDFVLIQKLEDLYNKIEEAQKNNGSGD